MKIKTLATLIMAGALISGGVNAWAGDDGDDGYRNGGYSERSGYRDNDDSGYRDSDRNRDRDRNEYNNGRYMDGSRDDGGVRCNDKDDAQDGDMNCDNRDDNSSGDNSGDDKR
jgi:hypothetical protein